MTDFKPTYLCIKQHTVTGLLYLCKTTQSYEDMLYYKGSGKPYWNNHLIKHGKEFVETVWFELFTEKDELVKFALMLSEQMDIVKAKNENGQKIWANLKFENGLDGTPKGTKFSDEHRSNIAKAGEGRPQSLETRARRSKSSKGIKRGEQSVEHITNRSNALKGNTNGKGNKNKPKSEEFKANLRKPQEKVKCPYCPIEGGIGLMKRYHFDNCKYKNN